MPVEALGALGLKAIVEFVLFTIELQQVPKRVSRCLELVRTCDRDLQRLIDLRNELLELLEKRPKDLQNSNRVIEDATHSIAGVCRLVEKCRPDANYGQTGMMARLWWKTIDSSEFDTQRPIIEQQHSAVLHEITYLRQMALVMPAVEGVTDEKDSGNLKGERRKTTVEFKNFDLLAGFLGGPEGMAAPGAVASMNTGAPAQGQPAPGQVGDLSAANDVRVTSPPPPPSSSHHHHPASIAAPITGAAPTSSSPQSIVQSRFPSFGPSSAKSAREREIEEGLVTLFADTTVAPSQPAWQAPGLQAAQPTFNQSVPTYLTNQRPVSHLGHPTTAVGTQPGPTPQWPATGYQVPSPPAGIPSAHQPAHGINQPSLAEMQRLSLISNASTPSLTSPRNSLPAPPLNNSPHQSLLLDPSLQQQVLRPMASQSSLLLSKDPYGQQLVSHPPVQYQQTSFALPLNQGLSQHPVAPAAHSTAPMQPNNPTTHQYGAGLVGNPPLSFPLGASVPSTGVGLLSHAAAPTAANDPRPSRVYNFSLLGDPGSMPADQAAGLGLASPPLQHPQQTPSTLLAYNQTGDPYAQPQPPPAPPAQAQDPAPAIRAITPQPLSTIPPEMIYQQPGAAATSYFTLPPAITPAPLPPPPAAPTPAPAAPVSQVTSPTPSYVSASSSTSPIELNYGIVGQLAAASQKAAATPATVPVRPFSAFGSMSTVASSVLLTPPAGHPPPPAVELPGVSMTRYESMAPAELDGGVVGQVIAAGQAPAELGTAGKEMAAVGGGRESVSVVQDNMPAW